MSDIQPLLSSRFSLPVTFFAFFPSPFWIGVHGAAESDMTERLNNKKAVAPHPSALAWRIPWAEEPGGLQSMGSLRVRQDWATSLSLFTVINWRRNWQPTPVFLPGESQGQGSLVGCRLWGRTELDTTEWLSSSSNTELSFPYESVWMSFLSGGQIQSVLFLYMTFMFYLNSVILSCVIITVHICCSLVPKSCPTLLWHHSL